jgi:microcystin-dependent protein
MCSCVNVCNCGCSQDDDEGNNGSQLPFGQIGPQGNNGWTPQLAVIQDGARDILKVTGFVGGQGTPPNQYIGQYVSAAGYTTVISEATNIKGSEGPGSTVPGPPGPIGPQGPAGQTLGGSNGGPGQAAAVTTGMIMIWPGVNLPGVSNEWLRCRGQLLDKGVFSVLYDIIGDAYANNGDVIGLISNNFRLPNFQERVPVGRNPDGSGAFNVLGHKAGSENHTLSQAETPLKSHSHGGTATGSISGSTGVTGAHKHAIWSNENGSGGSALNTPERTQGNNNGTSDGLITYTGNAYDYAISSTAGADGAHEHPVTGSASVTINADGSDAALGHNNMQPYLIIDYIIKT